MIGVVPGIALELGQYRPDPDHGPPRNAGAASGREQACSRQDATTWQRLRLVNPATGSQRRTGDFANSIRCYSDPDPGIWPSAQQRKCQLRQQAERCKRPARPASHGLPSGPARDPVSGPAENPATRRNVEFLRKLAALLFVYGTLSLRSMDSFPYLKLAWPE